MKKIRIGVTEKNRNPYWGMVNAGFHAAGAQLDMEFTIDAPEYEDLAAQLRMMEAQVSAGCDGLAFVATDAAAFGRTVRAALERGIPVVTFDLDAPESGRYLYVGSEAPADLGRRAGRLMVNLLHGTGKVGVQTGSSKAPGALGKLAGFREVVEAAGVTVVGGADDGEHLDIAADNARALLRDHPDLKGLYGVYGYHPGVQAAAAEALGREDLAIVGFDMLPETIRAIERGLVNASIWIQEYYFGYFAAAALSNLIRLGPRAALTMLGMRTDDLGPNVRRLPATVFTRSNLEQYLSLVAARSTV